MIHFCSVALSALQNSWVTWRDTAPKAFSLTLPWGCLRHCKQLVGMKPNVYLVTNHIKWVRWGTGDTQAAAASSQQSPRSAWVRVLEKTLKPKATLAPHLEMLLKHIQNHCLLYNTFSQPDTALL